MIVPIFIPHQGCPHQCVFCSQQAITGQNSRLPSPQWIQREVHRLLPAAPRRASSTQIAFYGGNFLGLKQAAVLSLLEAVTVFVDNQMVDSIRFSTRPDTVNPEIMDLLAAFPVATVELGAQSMDDRVLRRAGRGHRAADTVAAAHLVKQQGYQLGLQMMVGLPGDNDAGAIKTARRLAALKPDFVRIYPTLVLEGSPLAGWFRSGRYRPMPLEDCVQLVKQIYLDFKAKQIPVVRMGLQASDGLSHPGHLLAGPYHPAFGHLVHAAIVFEALSATIEKMAAPPDPMIITAPPRMISRVQGLNKQNLSQLKHAFGLNQIRLIPDEHLAANRLTVAGKPVDLP